MSAFSGSLVRVHILEFNSKPTWLTKWVEPTGAVSLISVQSIAVVTATTETADGVSAPSVWAEGVYHPALVYIWGEKMADENQQLKEPQQSLAGGGCTFEEGSAVEEVAPVRETWATGAELLVRRGASLGAFVTFRAPGHAHGAAAGIHPVPPWDGSATALVLVSHVTVLRTQICKRQEANISADVQTTGMCRTNGAHRCISGRWHQQSFQEGTCSRRSPACWCIRRWCTVQRRLGTHRRLEAAAKRMCDITALTGCFGLTGPLWHQGGPYLHRGSPGLWRSLYYRLDLKWQHTCRWVYLPGWGWLQVEHNNPLTFFTFATGAVPGFPKCCTAVGLQRGPIDVGLAAVVDNL